MTDVLTIILLATVASVFALIGGVIFLTNKKLRLWLDDYATALAAGILLAVSLIGLFPEAVEAIGELSFLVVLITILSVYLFEHLICKLHHHDSHEHTAAWLVILGDTIHNFIDGVTIGATYLISPALGTATAISSFCHEVPHEVADFGVLLHANYSRRKVFLVNLYSSLVTIVGALLVFWLNFSQKTLGILLAISAGMLLYLGGSDFLPAAAHHDQYKNKIAMLMLVAGALVMTGILMLLPHVHGA